MCFIGHHFFLSVGFGASTQGSDLINLLEIEIHQAWYVLVVTTVAEVDLEPVFKLLMGSCPVSLPATIIANGHGP